MPECACGGRHRGAGEGKSFTAFHLALSFTAEPDLIPVLVDADLMRQQTSRLFSRAAGGGLAASLDHGAPLAGAICRTDISRLHLLPVGAGTQSAIEHLGGPRWNRAVAEMHAAGPERLFVVDTPPVLATTEAQYLARSADIVLFVVRSEVTPVNSVSESLSASARRRTSPVLTAGSVRARMSTTATLLRGRRCEGMTAGIPALDGWCDESAWP
jgi:Mrp family chromosome partitioning ATPase